ncbi:MAG: hypothetical protein APR53_02845 [Methanoculleus sp. SDB]|nr:MAG: hypothetical protein APR53_02845 [Methanoculleus sp. SDB]
MAAIIPGLATYAPVIKVVRETDQYCFPQECIAGVEIQEHLKEPDSFQISFNDDVKISTPFRWLNDPAIRPGTIVTIDYGYSGSRMSRFLGKIQAINPSYTQTGMVILGIEGYDLSYDLKKTRKEFKDNNVKYSDIATEIAFKNNLGSSVTDSEQKHAKVERKKNEKDYEFLARLAHIIEFEFFVRGKILYFRKPADRLWSDYTFEFRKNIISFNPRFTTATMANEVTVLAWDVGVKDRIAETVTCAEIGSQLGISDISRIIEQSLGNPVQIKLEGKVVRSREEARKIAVAELKKRNECYIEGFLECIGDPSLHAGMTVNVLNVGDLFSGVYYIKSARHTLNESGYRTSLNLCRCL